MKNLLILMTLGILIGGCRKDIGDTGFINENISSNNSFDTVNETALPVYKLVYTAIGTDVKSGYAEVLPSLYYKTTKRYPLIVFNHGVGENGNTGKALSGLSCCGLPNHARYGTFPAKFMAPDGKYYSFIVVAPQYYNRPTAAQVQEVVNYAMNKYRVDTNMVYVMGLSQGGGVTMDAAASYGEKYAAIFPSCPGLSPTSTKAQMIASKNLPIWWTYGDKDNLVPYSQGVTWQNLIDGYNTVYASKTILQKYVSTSTWTASHNNTWAKAFNPKTTLNGKNAYEWLLQYKRDGNIPPVAKVSNDFTVSWDYPWVYGTYSYDVDGWIAAFKWTQVGGPAASITSSTAGKTSIGGMVKGNTYTFRCTVTDNKGATSYDDVKITRN